MLPPVTNETITLVKDTSMAFTISIAEMFTVAKQIGAAQTSVVPLLAAGVFYYIFKSRCGILHGIPGEEDILLQIGDRQEYRIWNRQTEKSS